MATHSAFFETWQPRALAVLRIVTGYLLIPHGTAKLLRARRALVLRVPLFPVFGSGCLERGRCYSAFRPADLMILV